MRSEAGSAGAIPPSSVHGFGDRVKGLVRQAFRKRFVYLMLVPSVALAVVLLYYPPLSAFYYAFFRYDGFNQKFVGFENFARFFTDRYFELAVGNMLKLTVRGVVLSLTVPLAVALMVFHLPNDRMKGFYKIAFTIPIVVPGMVSTLLWRFIYNPQLGILNWFLRGIGLDFLTRAWLADFKLALYAIMFAGFPWVGGVSMLIYLAGLQNIPKELLDAAAIDGASGLRRVWAVELPLIIGQIKLQLVLSVIGNIQGFQRILVMTQGGPGHATTVPALMMYQWAFASSGTGGSAYGYASAIGVVLFLVILGLTYLNMRYLRSPIEYEGS
jgi:raffinose/stachyose/melibiose transport system permease protein